MSFVINSNRKEKSNVFYWVQNDFPLTWCCKMVVFFFRFPRWKKCSTPIVLSAMLHDSISLSSSPFHHLRYFALKYLAAKVWKDRPAMKKSYHNTTQNHKTKQFWYGTLSFFTIKELCSKLIYTKINWMYR